MLFVWSSRHHHSWMTISAGQGPLPAGRAIWVETVPSWVISVMRGSFRPASGHGQQAGLPLIEMRQVFYPGGPGDVHGLGQVRAHLAGLVGVGAEGDSLAAELDVPAQDIEAGRHRVAPALAQDGGVEVQRQAV